MKIVLPLVLSIIFPCMVLAGETPSIMLKTGCEKQEAGVVFTGNSTIDFFSTDAPTVTKSEPFRKVFEAPEEEQAGGEKSPWLAGGMSLLLPGAGEVYTHSYVKAGVFFGIEVASFFLGRSYNKKGDDQTTFFQNYADAHYSAYRYAQWTLDNISLLNPNLSASNYHPFNTGVAHTGPPFYDVNWSELNKMEKDIGGNSSPTGYTHQMPYYGEQQYYELIGKYTEFMVGWDNVDPNYYNDPSTFASVIPVIDHTLPVNSTGLSQAAWYFDQRAEANRYYDIGNTYYTVEIINHIISAIDAYWSATRYNSSWHPEAQIKWLPTPTGMVAVPEAKVSYSF